ncbi:Kunitz/Bovine pancreatic trypsin inhibitor domain protein, partial [Ancylostoma caninum]
LKRFFSLAYVHRCPTAFWCHEGDDESSYYCCPRNRKYFIVVSNQCHLPPVVGHGKKAMRRFYYDWSSDGCHELTYTGLGGNENSFLSYEECEKTCRGAGEPTVAVPEDAMISKNKKVTKTSSSTFPTITESTSSSSSSDTVTSSTPKEAAAATKAELESTTVYPSTTPGTTTTALRERTTKAAATTTSAVEELVVTTPQVTTSEHGEELPTTRWMGTNPCEKTPDKGSPGGVAQKMWYFDQSALSCQPFTYLGSGGNANRFVDRETCMRVCGSGANFLFHRVFRSLKLQKQHFNERLF